MVRNLFAFLTLLFGVDAGSINVNLQLGTNKIGLQSSYQFTLTLSTQLQDASTVYFDFDQSLGVGIPNPVVCTAITGFSSNPSCTRISETRIAMACTTRLSSTYPNYAVQINGITNPGSAMSLTNQISVSSYIANSLLDQSTAIYVTYQANNVDSSKGAVSSLRPTVAAYAPFKATLKVENKIPSNGQIILKFPKWDNPALGANYLNSMVSQATVTSCSSPLNAPTCSVQLITGSSLPDIVVVKSPFANSGTILPGTTIEVTVTNVHNPPTLQPRSGFEIYTADSQGNLIDRCVNLKLTLTTAATATLGASYVTLSGQQGLSQPGTYQFFYQISNPIPSGGSLQLTLPPQVSIADISLLQYTGLANIAQYQVLVAGQTASQVNLNNSIVSYLMSGSGIMFTLNGITNPSSVETTNSFAISTFDEANFPIETLSQGLTVQAQPGHITGLVFQPSSQNGIRQYVTDFTVKATIETKLDSTAVITIELSTDAQSFQILSDQKCTILGMNQGVIDGKINCVQTQKSRIIVITGFVLDTVPALTQLSFKIQNLAIRNPVSVRYAATVSLYTSNALYRLDTGTSAVFYAVPSQLLSVSVTPSVFYTGQKNVEYLFTVQAPGSIPKNAFVQVIFPPDVQIQNPNLIQNSCNNYFSSGLPSSVGSPIKINCSVVQQTQVQLSNMFQYGSTGDSTTFQFTLPGIQNPRAVNQATDSFQVFLFEDTQMQYGVYNLSYGITVTMLSPSLFQGVVIVPSSYTNRNSSSSYTFSIQTLASSNTTDTVTVKFPDGITLPQNPTCKGDAISLNSTLDCIMIAADTLKLTLKFFVSPPSQFWFQVASLSNPLTTKPTNSFQIVQQNFLGNKVQEQTGNLTIQMRNGAVLPQYKIQITPSTFDSGVVTNYLISYELSTIQDGMYVEVDFPVDIQIISNATCLNDVQCVLVQQTSKQGLLLFKGQTIRTQSISGFTIVGVRNPIDQVEVLVSLRSLTSDGYLVEIIDNFKLNFQCASPCTTCVENSNKICASCDPLGKANLFQGMCYAGCPPGYYLQDEQCLECQKSCLGCVAWRNCTTCSDTSVYINELCVAETSFSYFCPTLIISVLWIMTACITKQIMESGLCKCPKKDFNIIPIVIHGLCWANQLLVVIEMLVYYSYNMQGIMAGEIVCGIIVPLTITVVFIVLYFKWVHQDEQIQKHLNEHKFLTYYALASCFISVRCWKLLYSEIGKSTSLTALRDKFKKQNMHFSFACLVPDVCLALIAASAMQVGISHGINLIILLACERIIISSALLMSTLMEYSFKKTEKGGRSTIEVNSAYQDNSQTDLRVNIAGQGTENIETAIADAVIKGGGDLSVGGPNNQNDFDIVSNYNKNSDPLEGMGEQEKIDRALDLLGSNAKLSMNSSHNSVVVKGTVSFEAKRRMTIVDGIIYSSQQEIMRASQQSGTKSSQQSQKWSPTKNLKTSSSQGDGIVWDKDQQRLSQTDRKSKDASLYNSQTGLVKEDNFVRGVKVIYSDRSDTSVEELMEVTPSAFNEPNGRINAQSTGMRGLKEINIQGRSASQLNMQGFQKGQLMNELNDDDKPVVSSIHEINYRTAKNFNYGEEVHQVVTQFLANGEKTVITKKMSETRLSQAKKIQAGKKFVEDSNRSSSNFKTFGQRKLTTPDDSKTESLFTRTGKHSLDQSHRVLPKGPKNI